MKLLTLIFSFVIGQFAVNGQAIPDAVKQDDAVEKYFQSSFLTSKNAVYVTPTDLAVSNISFGIQRHLVSKFWVEAGITTGIGTLVSEDITEMFSTISALKYFSAARNLDVNIDADHPFSIKHGLGLDATIYKKIMGYYITSQVSYGLRVKYSPYDINYSVYDYSLSKYVSASNQFKRLSILPSLVYKMELYKNLGMDYYAGIGFSKFSTDKGYNDDDNLNHVKFSNFDYFFNLKLYFAF